MSFDASGGRIVVRDGTRTVFDSDEKLFYVTDYAAGSVGIVQKEAPQNLTKAHTLKTISSSASFVFGAFRIEFLSGSGVGGGGNPGYGWFNAGGTYNHLMLGGTGSTALDESGNIHHCALYSFRASGGKLYLDERVYTTDKSGVLSAIDNWPILNAFRIYYKIYCGAFL